MCYEHSDEALGFMKMHDFPLSAEWLSNFQEILFNVKLSYISGTLLVIGIVSDAFVVANFTNVTAV